jgi:hypothetical protein
MDLIAHLPRIMFSDADIEVLVWLLRVNGVKDVPSIKQCKASRELLKQLCEFEIKQFTGKLGHTYYINRPRAIIQHVRII